MLPISSYYGDSLTVAVGATNALNESVDAAVDFDSDTYVLTFTPADAGITSGDVTITVTATGTEGSVSRAFTITVEEGNVNTAPVLTPPSTLYALAGRLLTEQIQAYDADGDTITFSVSGEAHGEWSIGTYDGVFTFTPTADDVSDSPITFTVQAIADGGYDEETFDVVVEAAFPPAIDTIPDFTVAYGPGVTNVVAPVITATEGDEITASNVVVKAGTETPAGYVVFEDGVSKFAPAEADIGKTFTFTASATDLDGTTNVDFNVEVILAAPVLKPCSVEDWTATSFTAAIQSAVPGATSYRLRHIHAEANDTVVTDYVDNVSFPHVVSGLVATAYTYAVQAQRGVVNSAWSDAETLHLDTYLPPTYAIPMTGRTHDTYPQDFNALISDGSAPWYDARTIPGWYAVTNDTDSYSGANYLANSGGSSGTGLLSLRVDKEYQANRALGARAVNKDTHLAFGVVFTNQCQYPVTNLTVSFTAMQFRAYKSATNSLAFAYAKSESFITPASPVEWQPLTALDFISPYTNGVAGSAEIYPPKSEAKSANIALEGADALNPGEVIVLRWKLNSKNNEPTLGIDDLAVSWQCAWPRQTVIYLQ